MTESTDLMQTALTERLLVFEMFTECPRSVDVESEVSNRGLFCQESRRLLERNGLCLAQSAKPTELSFRRIEREIPVGAPSDRLIQRSLEWPTVFLGAIDFLVQQKHSSANNSRRAGGRMTAARESM